MEYYGDETRWFLGEVKGVDDPARLGRVKVRIFGIHDQSTFLIANSDLPWANVVMPVTQGGTVNTTAAPGLQPGAQVFGMFLDGKHSQIPLVLGTIPHRAGFRIAYDGSVPFPATAPSTQYNEGDTLTTALVNILQRLGFGDARAGTRMTANQSRALNGPMADVGGPSRAEQAFDYLKAFFLRASGGSPGYWAAAFVGCLMGASGEGLDPEGQGGIAGWTGARSRPVQGAPFANQLEYIGRELETAYAFVREYLRNNHTIEAAVETIYAWYVSPPTAQTFKLDNAEAISPWADYMRRGGIRALLQTAVATEARRKYAAAYERRVEDAMRVFNSYG